jgi:hypothetical protein
MTSEEEYGKRRAKETMEKMKHPKMRAIVDDFTNAFNVHIPPDYRLPFIRSWELRNTKSGPFKEISNRPRYNQPDLFYEMVNGEVQGKFHAIYYHQKNAEYMQKLVENYCARVGEVAKEMAIDWPITVGIGLEKLSFEYEAFVFQCRACLDRFARSVSYYFGFTATNIDGLKKKLKELSSKNPKAQKVLDGIEKNKELYLRIHELLQSKTKNSDFLKDWSDRDKAAHYGRILMRPLNIMIKPGSTTILHLARQEKGKDTFNLPCLTEIMKSFMQDLLKFITEIFSILFEE